MIRQKDYIESFQNESSEEEENIKEYLKNKSDEKIDHNKRYKEKLDSVDEQIEKYKNDPKEGSAPTLSSISFLMLSHNVEFITK